MITVEIDDSTQYATAYEDGKPVATLVRRRVYESGPIWKAYGLDGTLLFQSFVPLVSAIAATRVRFHLERVRKIRVNDSVRPLGVDSDCQAKGVEHMTQQTEENGVPNFDAMGSTELWAFWQRYHKASRKDASALVGRQKGYTGLARDLANYACNKSVAMQCRARGDIVAAQGYEAICDSIYNRLPKSLKW